MNYWLYRQRAKKSGYAMAYAKAADDWEVRRRKCGGGGEIRLCGMQSERTRRSPDAAAVSTGAHRILARELRALQPLLLPSPRYLQGYTVLYVAFLQWSTAPLTHSRSCTTSKLSFAFDFALVLVLHLLSVFPQNMAVEKTRLRDGRKPRLTLLCAFFMSLAAPPDPILRIHRGAFFATVRWSRHKDPSMTCREAS